LLDSLGILVGIAGAPIRGAVAAQNQRWDAESSPGLKRGLMSLTRRCQHVSVDNLKSFRADHNGGVKLAPAIPEPIKAA
jgi:hypothetical protein